MHRRISTVFFVSFLFFVVRNRPRFGQKFVDFVVVGFERVAHDQEVAAVAALFFCLSVKGSGNSTQRSRDHVRLGDNCLARLRQCIAVGGKN